MNSIETAPKDRPIIIFLEGGKAEIVSFRSTPCVDIDQNLNEIETGSFWNYWITTTEDGSYSEDTIPMVYGEFVPLGWKELK